MGPRTFNGECITFSINGTGNVDIQIKRIKLNHYLTPCTKMNPKYIRDLNVRNKSIKLSKTQGKDSTLGLAMIS